MNQELKHKMVAEFLFGVNCMGCFWRIFKLTAVVCFVAAIAGYFIYHTNWFQKKYLYPLPYQDLVTAAAHESETDPFLIYAVMRTESKYMVKATSPKGARGLMQIMPETGTWIADKLKLRGFHSDMLYEPAVNIRLGSWYLASLKQEFDGNLVLVLAAYNSGPGNVKQWRQQYGWPSDFSSTEQIPFNETRLYVTKVLKAYSTYKKIYGP